MEPVEVLAIAGVAAAGWAIGRTSRTTEGERAPGDAIADVGTRLSRNTAFAIAGVGARSLMFGASAASVAGAAASRAVGATADVMVATGGAMVDGTRRIIGGRRHATDTTSGEIGEEPRAPAADVTRSAGETETQGGIVLPADVNATI